MTGGLDWGTLAPLWSRSEWRHRQDPSQTPGPTHQQLSKALASHSIPLITAGERQHRIQSWPWIHFFLGGVYDFSCTCSWWNMHMIFMMQPLYCSLALFRSSYWGPKSINNNPVCNFDETVGLPLFWLSSILNAQGVISEPQNYSTESHEVMFWMEQWLKALSKKFEGMIGGYN